MKNLVLALPIVALAACSTPDGDAAPKVGFGSISIKNAVVIESKSGKQVLYTGTISGRPMGKSPFSIQTLDGSVTCSGSTTPAGKGEMSCSDGFAQEFQVPSGKYGTFNGSYAERLKDGRIMAFGWGSEANHDHLKRVLHAYKTAS